VNDLIVVEKIAQWKRLKTLVLDSVSSPITKRVYNMALDEFYNWFQQAPRPGFTKATVSAWRVSLEERHLGSSSIIVRMSAIRKLAAEAADNGLLAPELATGISRVKSVKSTGVRIENPATKRQRLPMLCKVVMALEAANEREPVGGKKPEASEESGSPGVDHLSARSLRNSRRNRKARRWRVGGEQMRYLKQILKQIPGGCPACPFAPSRHQSLKPKTLTVQETFTDIYRGNRWGRNTFVFRNRIRSVPN